MIYDDLIGEPLSPERSAQLGQRYSDLVLAEVLRCPMVDGALEFLEANPTDRPLYVASGSPHDELLHTIDQRSLTRLFTAAYGSPNEKPDVILAVLEDHDLRAVQVVFVGDAWSDLEAARATGVRFVGVVRSGASSPFPDSVHQMRDLVGLEGALALAGTVDPGDGSTMGAMQRDGRS
jgi:phosphoglycolate phosphatase-like HAD superfamily hydrolase